jgi:putative aminophosphonate oxidoreductase
LARQKIAGTDSGPIRSLWLREALAGGFDAAPRLEGEVRADVCIVGGGYTGLWTALRVKESEPGLDVVVLEADICGGGASGRNGGFVLTWWSKFISLAKICGTEEALRLARASAWAVAEIGTFCKAHGIDAHYRLDGWMWAATNQAQLDSWRPTLEALKAAGAEPFRELDPEETAKRTGSRMHLGGVLEASGATVQPALLALGLRRVALEAGVRIFEGSPMDGLERSESSGERRVRVRTQLGSLAAQRVVLAMNAWAVRFKEIRREVLVVGSDIVSTEPIPQRLAEIGWTDGLGISDSRLLVHYYRTTNDGRIAFGKGGGVVGFGGRIGRRFEGASTRRRHVERGFRFVYPMLSDVALTSSWTGPIDRSTNGLPFFGSLGGHPDVFYGVGYSGNGVGPSFVGGRILASLALGLDDEWSGCGLVGFHPGRFPPEPARYLGALAVRRAIQRKERVEDRGGKAGPITRRLVRLAPAGLVPAKRG